MIAYPGKIVYDHEDKIYNVRFLDFPGCITYGETLDETKEMARDALAGVLEVLDSRKIIVPKSSQVSEPYVYYIPGLPADLRSCPYQSNIEDNS